MKRIILITVDDEDFFAPPAINHLIDNCNDIDLKFFLVPGFLDLKRIFYMLIMLKFKEILEIASFKLKNKILKKKKFNSNKMTNLENVNSEFFIKYVNENKIDLIVSYNNIQIFKKKTIDLLKADIVNFHPGILPKYKGLFTNFYSLYNNEDEVGITFHKIIPKLDSGQTMDFIKFKIEKNETIFDLYKKLHLSDKTFKFIENCIRNYDQLKDISLVKEDNFRYNSYPKLVDVIKFKFKK